MNRTARIGTVELAILGTALLVGLALAAAPDLGGVDPAAEPVRVPGSTHAGVPWIEHQAGVRLAGVPWIEGGIAALEAPDAPACRPQPERVTSADPAP